MVKSKTLSVSTKPTERGPKVGLVKLVDDAFAQFMSENAGVEVKSHCIAVDLSGNFERAIVSILYEGKAVSESPKAAKVK